MNLTLILFLILMIFCINHPSLACFEFPISIESKWKNKENGWISSNSRQNWHWCS